MDITSVYLNSNSNKDQEQQAFIYELKRQIETVMAENLKLSEQNKKARKSMRLEEDNKVFKTSLAELTEEVKDLKRKIKDKDEMLEKLVHMKDL
mmetsp:Transcript_68508/g.147879  ORF Transcript_68508/g.147879 Transcript_68508/m.147879 type:complete len:94 (+) Transcript_68508:1030-1311(+)